VHRTRRRVAVAPRRAPRADRRLTSPIRRAFSVGAVLFAAASSLAFAQLSAAEVEDAAEVGRRAAGLVLRGDDLFLRAALDADAIGRRFLGTNVWRGLSERQRRFVRTTIRNRFVDALAPPRRAASEVAWSYARPEHDVVMVYLGLRYPSGVLKTRWSIARSPSAWKVQDVVLSDPGVSLAADSMSSFPAGSVRRRDRGREARDAALPRLLGIGAIAAIVVFLSRRPGRPGVTPQRLAVQRRLLVFTAAAPAILFTVDGILAVRRALSEPWSIPEVLAPLPWRTAEREALTAQRAGRLDDARRAWQRAVAAGSPASPAAYQLGVALRAAGRSAEAKVEFARALAQSPPAPGASKELGLIALQEGRSAEARDHLRRYLEVAGPDPDALSALAVASANLGEKTESVNSVEEARTLLADRWTGVRLQSQVYARAGDARRVIETLRALEISGSLDREKIRADPAYLPIATDPAWIAFLAETPPPRSTPGS
jgi:tetratricopeptide (TPR) repeat protein